MTRAWFPIAENRAQRAAGPAYAPSLAFRLAAGLLVLASCQSAGNAAAQAVEAASGAQPEAQSVTPDAVTPDAVTPDAVTPDAVLPDAVTPDAAAPRAAAPAPALTLHEQIDQQIDTACAAKGITPSPACTDAEFLRRVYLDLTGSIPTLGEARAFLEDSSPIKRSQLIDRLLASPEFARHMARVFDVMLMERRPASRIPQDAWEEYLRSSFAANKPWDQLSREILAADGTDPLLRPAARFYLDREMEANLLTRDVARVFLGMDMQCAQCHDHPLISGYLQADYYGLMAFLGRSATYEAPDKTVYILDKPDGEVSYKSVFIKDDTDHTTRPHLPGAAEIEEPKFEAGQEYAVAPADGVRPVPKYVRRNQLAACLASADTASFKRNIVNRLWALLMGRGLVHPLDLHHAANPPSHPELLEILAGRFAEMKFDVRQLLREIALSQAYQRSSETASDGPRPGPETFAVAPLKPLTAEQLGLAIMQATGLSDVQRISLGAALNERALHERIRPNLAQFVNLYGGLAGQSDASFQATLEQTLFVANGDTLRSWLAPQAGNLVDRLMRAADTNALATELYQSVQTRTAAPEEIVDLEAYLKDRAADRAQALAEVAWALIASAEFRFNH